jgi:glycosyltransferase involved in cell wall biosynthesis
VLRVIREVVEECPECRLVLTGDGPERKRIESLAEQLGLSDRVVLPGFSKDPLRATAAYDIALLNSWTEGLPNTIMEYFALGKAVICTRVGGIPEVVDDGRNGLMVSPGDDRALMDKIMMLVKDPALRARLGEEALATLRQRFTEDMMVEAYEGVLERAVAGKRS